MAVERKTFLWIGNDRGSRALQELAGISSGSDYGATGIGSWNLAYGVNGQQNDWVGIGNDAVTGNNSSRTTKKALDTFWNDKENWAERISGFSSGAGSSGDGDVVLESYYYIAASRIPHRADHVRFEYVTGTTGNGLVRNQVGSVVPGMNNKPFNAPLSPCLFGGQSTSTDGFSGEGTHWVNADTSGSSAANRQGPLSSIKVLPSYFHHAYGVLEERSEFFGYCDINSSRIGKYDRGIRFWGGRVSPSSAAGISGASFGNVPWSVGQTGINIKALDVQLNTPYRMPRLQPFGFPDTIQNPNNGRNITLSGDDLTPSCTCKVSHADSIVNMSVGARSFYLQSGNVINFRISDMYMPFASDEERKSRADGSGSSNGEDGGIPEKYGVGNGGVPLSAFSYNGTISGTLRCDPCWYNTISNFQSSIGSPVITFGPYFTTGLFSPRVTSPGTVTVFPQKITRFNLTDDDVINNGATTDPSGEGNDQIIGGHWETFSVRGTNNQRFALGTVKFEEFNPRWDVTTSGGNKSSSIGVRGFNNKMYIEAGCTITNLNLNAGNLAIGRNHPGGDTFDTTEEVGDVVILNGFAEQKAYINGEHPSVPGFNGFYIGKGGVNETGQNFQIRSRDAEFDFGAGVYLRSGPESTGVSGAGFAFVQAPSVGLGSKRP